MLHRYDGADGARKYTRVWVSCDQCCCEGEPVMGDTGADLAEALYGADFTIVDERTLCQRCRASAVGAA